MCEVDSNFDSFTVILSATYNSERSEESLLPPQCCHSEAGRRNHSSENQNYLKVHWKILLNAVDACIDSTDIRENIVNNNPNSRVEACFDR